MREKTTRWASCKEVFGFGRATIRRAIDGCMECRRRMPAIERKPLAPPPKFIMTSGWWTSVAPARTTLGFIDRMQEIGRNKIQATNAGTKYQPTQLEVEHLMTVDLFSHTQQHFKTRLLAPSNMNSGDGPNFFEDNQEPLSRDNGIRHDAVKDKERGLAPSFSPIP